MWCVALGLCIILAAPRALRLKSLKERARGMLGIRVRGEYEALPSDDKGGCGSGAILPLQDSPRDYLNVGQMFVVAGYAVFALICIVLQAPLMENPNRAGFLALAQLPPVFLFASKNSPLTALLLGPGVDYTKLNYIHRYALSGPRALLRRCRAWALWINNHVVWDLPILSQQKEGSGVAAFGTLCVFILSSIAPNRRWCYSGFLVIQ
ncbi:hypothetical protein C8R44DRAFT_885831 [Mycena epipterygia]|nr:hypothetical protein C8R44DRAFT_885831 [Mycena epipterygia]